MSISDDVVQKKGEMAGVHCVTFQARKSPGMPFPRLNEGAALAEKFNKRTVSALLVVRNLAVVSVCRSR